MSRLHRALLVAGLSLSVAARAQDRPASSPTPSTGEPWRIIAPPQATLVLARDGTVLGTIGRERRLSVPLPTLPPYVGQAFIAVEDKRFYQHDGVDLVGVAGALKDAVTKGELRGASTITQLLVGNMHPDVIDRRDRTPARKLREQQAARAMERHYTKAQILEAFLNQIPFGRGAYGIEMAARQYFAKGAAELTLAEAATLAAMPKSPVRYDPVTHPERSLERRNTVLALMAAQGYLTPAQARRAQQDPLRPVLTARAIAPWVTDVVRVQAERIGIPVTQGGYRLVTTVDAALQRLAQEGLQAEIEGIERRPGFRGARCAGATPPLPRRETPGARQCLEGVLVALDPGSGDVRALVGGRDYARSSFNRAVDGLRQPGSSFKPFAYAQALSQGLTANALLADTAVRLRLVTGQWYAPENADGAFLGPLTMREALVRSRNPVAVHLAMTVGLDSILALAQRSGIRSPIPSVPASVLGAGTVQPLDFIAAYAPFANGGSAVEPRVLLRIEDRSARPLWSAPAAVRTPVLDPRVAFLVRDILREAVERGTGAAMRAVLPSTLQVAGKTGTTNDNADVWFVGMTSDLVIGSWLGFDRPAPIAAGAAGGTMAAPLVGRVLARYYGNRALPPWTPPDGLTTVELDRATGRPASEATPPDRRYREYFLAGTEPGALAWPWSFFRLGPITP